MAKENIIKDRIKKYGTVAWREVKPLQSADFKKYRPEQIKKLKESIRKNGFTTPMFIWETPKGEMILLDGFHRIIAFKELESIDGVFIPEKVPALFVDCKDKKDAKKVLLILNSHYAEIQREALWDFVSDLNYDDLVNEIDIPTFTFDEIKTEADEEEAEKQKLADRFLVAPFSVFNAREGWWQDRKRAWINLGIVSEEGRGDNLLNLSEACKLQRGGKKLAKAFGTEGNATDKTGTSIFDPVLCEILYRWYTPAGGVVIDPFAGGSVRGIVGGLLGRRYYGLDIRKEQIVANIKQSKKIEYHGAPPVWRCNDSINIDSELSGISADAIISCPPYADLEVYSDNPGDISTMKYDDFLKAYMAIIEKSCSLLKNDRFAMFVVGEVRDKKGAYRTFVSDTISAFQDAGLKYYNEAILVTSVGTLPIRAGRTFSATRKLGKTHQNVLIFVKGDARKATEACGPVEVELPHDGGESD